MVLTRILVKHCAAIPPPSPALHTLGGAELCKLDSLLKMQNHEGRLLSTVVQRHSAVPCLSRPALGCCFQE